jgi:hypothetical protein
LARSKTLFGAIQSEILAVRVPQPSIRSAASMIKTFVAIFPNCGAARGVPTAPKAASHYANRAVARHCILTTAQARSSSGSVMAGQRAATHRVKLPNVPSCGEVMVGR